MFANLNFKHTILPHLLAILVFLTLTVAYFSPIFFEDKTLLQNDVLQFKGSAKELIDYREKTGNEALWTNSMFGGMPAYLISTRYSGDLVQYVQRIMMAGLPPVAANLFLALLCGYILFLVVGMRPLLAGAGAVALAFSSYNLIILEAGHNTKSLAIAFMPLVLAGLIYTFRRSRMLSILLGATVYALGLALQLRVNHVQITYYLMLMIAMYALIEFYFAVKEKALGLFFKKSVLLLLGTLLAVGVSFGRLYTTAGYGKHSIRGKSELSVNNSGSKISGGLDRDYAFNWSYGVLESMTLLVPEFYGGASQGKLGLKSEMGKTLVQAGYPTEQVKDALREMPMYWGDQPFTSGPVYLGAIVCFLFVLGLMLVNKSVRYWLLFATLLSLMLAWGRNFESFNYLLFDHLPGYNKFRAVSMALVIAQVAVPLLGIMGLHAFFTTPDSADLRKKLWYAGGITGGLCLLVILFAGSADFIGLQDAQLEKARFPMDALRADRASAMRSDAFRSLLFIAAAFGLLYFYLRQKVSVTLVSVLLGVFILIDLWVVDRRYLNTEKFVKDVEQQYFEPSPADLAILKDKDLSYRVYNPTAGLTSDGRTSYFHKSIGGYHGAKLRRYQDLIEYHLEKGNMQVINMLNTRYIITKPEQQPQYNPGAMGNAWFVNRVKPMQNPDQEIEALNTFSPSEEAVVDVSRFKINPGPYQKDGNEVRLTAYEPNDLKYEVNAAHNGLIVFSEIYYEDGWNAYLDGKSVPYVRANYVLRAMEVPAGKHQIEFKFEPTQFAVGNLVSLLASIILLAGSVLVIVLNVRARAPKSELVV